MHRAGVFINPSPSPDSPGENCLIDQHGYLKIIDFGVAERITSGRIIYAVPDLGFLECFGKFTCFSMEECCQKIADADDTFPVLVAQGHAQTRIFKRHRVLIGASSTVVRTIVKDQAVLHHSKRLGQGNSTLHGTGGPQKLRHMRWKLCILNVHTMFYKGQRERSHFQLFHIISNIHNQT